MKITYKNLIKQMNKDWLSEVSKKANDMLNIDGIDDIIAEPTHQHEDKGE